MNKCDCYRVEPEVHRFADKNGDSIYGRINVPRCYGTKEKDICDCRGDKSRCDFYEHVRAEASSKKGLEAVNDGFDKIENLIREFWSMDPIYYTNSKDEQEARCAKLCCKILEVIQMAKDGKTNEEDS